MIRDKVLFILHLPPPIHGSSLVGKFISESNLINTKFKCKFINLGTSKSIDEIGKNRLKKWIIYFLIILRTIKELMVFKPDLVYIAMTAKGIGFYKDAIVVFFVKVFGAKLVIHLHNKGVSIRQNNIIDNFLYNYVFSSSKVILLSKFLYGDIKKYVNEIDVFYCPNGIPELNKNENNFRNVTKIPTILFLSNLIESKGVYLLLDALKILKNKKIKFFCNFVGGIGDITEHDFNDKVRSFQLIDCVNYLGKKFNDEKRTIFKNSDIFVLPSFNECFPLVLLEASQFRLPIISTFEGAIPEIVKDGVNGYLVPKKDAIELANKLEILIKDKGLRTKLGNAAYKEYIGNYTFSKFENKMYSILKSI